MPLANSIFHFKHKAHSILLDFSVNKNNDIFGSFGLDMFTGKQERKKDLLQCRYNFVINKVCAHR